MDIMALDYKCVLPNVKEYGEEYPVEICIDKDRKAVVLSATTEGGYASTAIDLSQLYTALVQWMIDNRIATDGYPQSEAAFDSIQKWYEFTKNN